MKCYFEPWDGRLTITAALLPLDDVPTTLSSHGLATKSTSLAHSHQVTPTGRPHKDGVGSSGMKSASSDRRQDQVGTKGGGPYVRVM